MSIRITHVRFADGVRDHPHISAVKWVDLQSGETNSSTKAVIVDWIDNKNGKAYVGTGASQVQVGTVHPSGAAAYLRTYADGQWTNNLVSLPEF